MVIFMKKYYCPYCGEPTRKWYHKLSSRAKNIVADYQKRCNICRHFIPIKSHFGVGIILVLEICLMIISIYLFVNSKMMYGYISFFAYIVLLFTRSILEVVLGKFVKYDDDAKGDKYYKCSVELTNNMKHPKLYFHGTSVVLLLFEQKTAPIPVRVEPLEINYKSCKCKIAFVLEKPTEEFVGNAFTLIDNDKIVGKGRFE